MEFKNISKITIYKLSQFAFFCFFLLLLSCKSIDKMTAYKDLHWAGHSKAKNYIDYNIDISSKYNFEVIYVKLIGYEKALVCYYYNKTTHLSSSIKDKPFQKGQYTISFRIEDTVRFNNLDQVEVNLLLDNKKKLRLNTPVVKGQVYNNK